MCVQGSTILGYPPVRHRRSAWRNRCIHDGGGGMPVCLHGADHGFLPVFPCGCLGMGSTRHRAGAAAASGSLGLHDTGDGDPRRPGRGVFRRHGLSVRDPGQEPQDVDQPVPVRADQRPGGRREDALVGRLRARSAGWRQSFRFPVGADAIRSRLAILHFLSRTSFAYPRHQGMPATGTAGVLDLSARRPPAQRTLVDRRRLGGPQKGPVAPCPCERRGLADVERVRRVGPAPSSEVPPRNLDEME